MPQKKLALKVDAATFHGTLTGVPRLVETLRRHDAQATFLFALGPDHSGRAPGRLFAAARPGLSALERHGLATLLYGTLLPGPDIGRRCADILRGVRDSGFETGIHAWDCARWQVGIEHADARWIHAEMRRAIDRYASIFGCAPLMHGAAGWQMNAHALRLTQRLGFDYCSDSRGSHPFIPVHNAEIVLCPQLPTTLPTLDELLGRDGITEGNVHERLLELTAQSPPAGHVYTLHAELEGRKFMPVFERLLEGWRAQGYELSSLRGLYDSLDAGKLPRHEVLRGEVAGRAGTLMLQGEEFLA